jgi:Flp pilus assembly pilin Flp
MGGDSRGGRNRDIRPVVQGVRQNLRRFLAAETGSTAIEYGLIVTLIALMTVAFLQSFSDRLSNFFLSVAGAMNPS